MLQILTHLGAQVERASGTVIGDGRKDRIDRALRCRAQNARVGLRDRAAAGPLQGSDGVDAGRLRHWRSADRFASERI